VPGPGTGRALIAGPPPTSVRDADGLDLVDVAVDTQRAFQRAEDSGKVTTMAAIGERPPHGDAVIVRRQIGFSGLPIDVGFNNGDKFEVEKMTDAQRGPGDPTVVNEHVLCFGY